MEKIIFIILLVCIILLVLLVLYGLVRLAMCYIDIFLKKEKPRNKVHFYVARDKIGTIWLYIGKPKRDKCSFCSTGSSIAITESRYFSKCGLDANDYVKIRWEDEPVEVFLNMED